MYEKNKNQRITLRLDDVLFSFVRTNSEMIGVSPSEFIRMMLNSIMINSNQVKEKLKKIEETEKQGRENDEANLDN